MIKDNNELLWGEKKKMKVSIVFADGFIGAIVRL